VKSLAADIDRLLNACSFWSEGDSQMVLVIGVLTIVALCWLLAASMANESEAEKRRLSTFTMPSGTGQEGDAGSATRHAA
jgi:predicted acyltransferase